MNKKILTLSLVSTLGLCSEAVTEVSVARSFRSAPLRTVKRGGSQEGIEIGVAQTVRASDFASYYYGGAVTIPTSSEGRVLADAKFGGLVKPFENANYSFKLGLLGTFAMSGSDSASKSGANVVYGSAIETGYRYHLGDEGSMDINLIIPTSDEALFGLTIGFSKTI